MVKQEKQRGGGAKMSRSETMTVRLAPKLRYLAELAGRKQRRSLTGFIKWAIEEGLDKVQLKEGGYSIDPAGGCEQYPHDMTVAKAAADLWDVDEADRFIKLALRFPDLLTYEEQVLWKLIRENGYLWRGAFSGPEKQWTWTVCQSAFCFKHLRAHWPTFMAVAHGEEDRSALPAWEVDEPTGQTERFHSTDNLPILKSKQHGENI